MHGGCCREVGPDGGESATYIGRREWREGVITQEKRECYNGPLLGGRWMDDMNNKGDPLLTPSQPPRPHSKLRCYMSALGLL